MEGAAPTRKIPKLKKHANSTGNTIAAVSTPHDVMYDEDNVDAVNSYATIVADNGGRVKWITRSKNRASVGI